LYCIETKLKRIVEVVAVDTQTFHQAVARELLVAVQFFFEQQIAQGNVFMDY